MAELLELGRKKPGGLTFGSAGVGSTAHLLAAQIGRGTKTPITFVQYRGGAPLMADLITGRLDFAFASYTSARSNMEGGKLRALAVDAEKRLPATPDVPTMIEVGLGSQRIADWFGLVGPAGMPDARGRADQCRVPQGRARSRRDQAADRQRHADRHHDAAGDGRHDARRGEEHGASW